MALMTFREPNEVRWVGTRPGHRGTQIRKSETANNTAVILHTVSDGFKFYLCDVSIGFNDTILGVAVILVRNIADVTVFQLLTMRTEAGKLMPAVAAQYWPPIEIPEKWDICVASYSVGLSTVGFCHGWEE